jgi:monofunctional glycosyltransferase
MWIKHYIGRLSGPFFMKPLGEIYLARCEEVLYKGYVRAFDLKPKAGAAQAPLPFSPAKKNGKALRFLARLGIRTVKAVVWAHVWFILCTCLLLFVYKFITPSVTILMFYRKFESGYAIQRPIPVKLSRDIGKWRTRMLVKIEDGNFHHGIDFAAVKYAYYFNQRVGSARLGGSTLSMQTARSLFLIPVRNYFRKYLEAIITVEAEAILGKNRILELYFSTAEWGKGIFGIQAASKAYYGEKVNNISDERFVRLVSLLASPLRYTPRTLFSSPQLSLRYRYLANRYLSQ